MHQSETNRTKLRQSEPLRRPMHVERMWSEPKLHLQGAQVNLLSRNSWMDFNLLVRLQQNETKVETNRTKPNPFGGPFLRIPSTMVLLLLKMISGSCIDYTIIFSIHSSLLL